MFKALGITAIPPQLDYHDFNHMSKLTLGKAIVQARIYLQSY